MQSSFGCINTENVFLVLPSQNNMISHPFVKLISKDLSHNMNPCAVSHCACICDLSIGKLFLLILHHVHRLPHISYNCPFYRQ